MMILSAWALFRRLAPLQPKFRSLALFKNAESRLNNHWLFLFGFSSIGLDAVTWSTWPIPRPEASTSVGTTFNRASSTQPVWLRSSPATGGLPKIPRHSQSGLRNFPKGSGSRRILNLPGCFPAQTEAALAQPISPTTTPGRSAFACFVIAGHMYRTNSGSAIRNPGDSGRLHNPPQGNTVRWRAYGARS